jgi:hypothetical protein
VIAAEVDSTMLKCILEDTDVVLSEIQDKVPGITLVAQLMLMVATLKFKLDVDNTFTSVVLECGLEQDQSQDQRDIQKEKLISDTLE